MCGEAIKWVKWEWEINSLDNVIVYQKFARII
jgi:hypothetical protein